MADNVLMRAGGGHSRVIVLSRAVLQTCPGPSKLVTGQGLTADTNGVFQLHSIGEETLQLVIDCVSRFAEIERYLKEIDLPIEQLYKLLTASDYLGLRGVRDAAFKEFGGTFAVRQTYPILQISSDGHTVQRLPGAGAWKNAFARGRLACPVGASMRVRFIMGGFWIMVGFAPHEAHNEHFYPNGCVWASHPSDGSLYYRDNASKPFPGRNHPNVAGDVLEMEINNIPGDPTLRFWKNGDLLGTIHEHIGGQRPMYPVVGIHDADQFVRMELVSFTMEQPPVQGLHDLL